MMLITDVRSTVFRFTSSLEEPHHAAYKTQAHIWKLWDYSKEQRMIALKSL